MEAREKLRGSRLIFRLDVEMEKFGVVWILFDLDSRQLEIKKRIP